MILSFCANCFKLIFQMSVQEEEQPRTPTTTTSSSNNNNSLAIDIIHDLKEEGSDTLLVELKKVFIDIFKIYHFKYSLGC